MTPNGIAIRAIRRDKAMRLCDLAARASLSISYLSRLERGEAGASDETILRIAEALGVSPADITRGEDEMATTLAEPRAVPAPSTPEGELFHYTPEEAEKWLPWSARILRDRARSYTIPHNRGGGRITFTGLDIREISLMTAQRPVKERAAKKPRPRRRTPAAA